jgi:hypothetical protein
MANIFAQAYVAVLVFPITGDVGDFATTAIYISRAGASIAAQ